MSLGTTVRLSGWHKAMPRVKVYKLNSDSHFSLHSFSTSHLLSPLPSCPSRPRHLPARRLHRQVPNSQNALARHCLGGSRQSRPGRGQTLHSALELHQGRKRSQTRVKFKRKKYIAKVHFKNCKICDTDVRTIPLPAVI